MATSPLRLQQGYGIGNALQPLPPFSIIANRAPTQQDKARIGTFWTYTALNNVYVLTSVTGGVSNWLTLSNGGAGVFLSLTVNGPSTFAGNITQTAGVTTLLATTTGGLTNNGVFTNNGNAAVNGTLNITENVADTVITTNSNRLGGSRHLLCNQTSVDANGIIFTTVKSRAGAVVDPADSLFQQNINALGNTAQTTSARIEVTAGTPIPAQPEVPCSLAIATTDTAGVFATRINISTTGAVTMPSQPMFFAYANASQAPSTGDGTVAQIIFPDTDFNVSNSYNAGTGVFTAPVTGKYLFGAALLMGGIAVPMNQLDLYFLVSGAGTGQSVRICSLNPTPVIFAGQFFATTGTHMTEMTAGQTINVRIAITNGPLDAFVVGNAGAERRSYFYGQLVA